jgi:hypothetical protein
METSMARIRYIDEQLITRAFDHTFYRNHRNQDHGLEAGQVVILTSNPQFEVKDPPHERELPAGATGR